MGNVTLSQNALEILKAIGGKSNSDKIANLFNIMNHWKHISIAMNDLVIKIPDMKDIFLDLEKFLVLLWKEKNERVLYDIKIDTLMKTAQSSVNRSTKWIERVISEGEMLD